VLQRCCRRNLRVVEHRFVGATGQWGAWN
jgi:hypothetical protein